MMGFADLLWTFPDGSRKRERAALESRAAGTAALRIPADQLRASGAVSLLLATYQNGTTNVDGLLLAWPDRLGRRCRIGVGGGFPCRGR